VDHFLTIWSVITYIEERLSSDLDPSDLARSTGLSLAYLRELFAKTTGGTLARYILSRRIANAAYELLHTQRSALEIAYTYGFQNPDTFTRAFRRDTGMTPHHFRSVRPQMARMKLSAGVYGISFVGAEIKRKRMVNMEQKMKETVLYGVPKVHYGAYHGCTPYPICLKACMNYMGNDVPYHTVMVLSAAAFRLTWNTAEWDGGNVDICYAFDDPMRSYSTGIKALGRKCEMIWRAPEATKAEFMGFLKKRIDRGNPCVALGIIGPPEACVVTGYREKGDVLLGWNVFQDNPEFGGNTRLDDSGYFISDDWWENPSTIALISIEESTGAQTELRQILETAAEVLTGRQYGNHAKGINAYEAWRKAIADDSQFSQGTILPLLAERLMCQGDAMDCLADGRSSAARYFRFIADSHPEQKALSALAECFEKVAKQVYAMIDLLGGWQRGEPQMLRLNDPEVRRSICARIDAAKEADSRALDAMFALIPRV